MAASIWFVCPECGASPAASATHPGPSVASAAPKRRCNGRALKRSGAVTEAPGIHFDNVRRPGPYVYQ